MDVFDGLPGVKFVTRFGFVGFVAGVLAVVAVVALGESVRFAGTKLFAVAALAFGFALLGWSGSVFAGEAIENMHDHLDSNSDWTEADSRRAMTVIGSFGAGAMLGVVVMTTVLRAAY